MVAPKKPTAEDDGGATRRVQANKETGARLALWRESVKYRKLKIARELNISHQRWHHYETGRNELDLIVAIDLCTKQNLTLDWIYRGVIDGLHTDVAGRIDATLRRKRRQKPK